MKNNRLMKLFLSILMVLTITCTNANLILGFNLNNGDLKIELFAEDSNNENSPFPDKKN